MALKLINAGIGEDGQFDDLAYAAANPDVASDPRWASAANGMLAHWLTIGRHEGRQMADVTDPSTATAIQSDPALVQGSQVRGTTPTGDLGGSFVTRLMSPIADAGVGLARASPGFSGEFPLIPYTEGGPALSNRTAFGLAPLALGAALTGGAAAAGVGSTAGAGGAGSTGAGLSTSTLSGLAEGAGLGSTTGALGADWAGATMGSGGLIPAAADTAGFGASLGTPVASGVSGLPAWAEVAGAATPAAAATGGGAAATGAAGVAGGAGSAAAIARILDGSASTQDWLSVLGTVGATGLGMYSSNKMADTIRGISAENRADRLPYLNASLGYLNDPASYGAGPGMAATKNVLGALGAKFGNPIGSGTALQLATDAGLRDWREAVTGFGNMGLSGADTRARLGVEGAQANADVYSNLAGGISELINPKPRQQTLADLWRSFNVQGLT